MTRAPVYYVENTVRRVGTRMHRVMSPTRHRFKIFINGQRLLRSKKMPLNAEQFATNEKKLVEMCLAGQVAIYTPDGVKVTTTHTGLFILTKPNGAQKVLAQGEIPTCFGGDGVALVQKTPAAKEVVTSAKELDDLTTLPGIGSGRARKLVEGGIETFAAVVELGIEGLMEVLNITEEVAEEVIDAADQE